jgi:iron-sulfur cluster assembly protein
METKCAIAVTPLAAEQIKLQLQRRGTPDNYLRIGIKGAGCHGYSYVIKFEDTSPKETDKVFSYHDINVVVDPKSLLYLNGCTLDWEQSLLKRGFKFLNPNEKSSCGCGKSFAV